MTMILTLVTLKGAPGLELEPSDLVQSLDTHFVLLVLAGWPWRNSITSYA